MNEFGAPAETTKAPPPPIKITLLKADVVAAALDIERAPVKTKEGELPAGAALRYESVKNWLTVEFTETSTAGAQKKPLTGTAVNLTWSAESVRGPISVAYKPGEDLPGGKPLAYYAKSKLGASDLSRIFSMPLYFGGKPHPNTPLMGTDAVVTFPGEDASGATPDEELPLNPSPVPWASVFENKELERAAVLIGTSPTGQRSACQCVVRRVRLSAKVLRDHYTDTIAWTKNLTDKEINIVSAAQRASIIAQNEKLAQRLDALAVAQGNADLNAYELIVYQYSAVNWQATTPYAELVGPTEPAMQKHLVAHDNRFKLEMQATATNKKNNTYMFEYHFVVPLLTTSHYVKFKRTYKEEPAVATAAAVVAAPPPPPPTEVPAKPTPAAVSNGVHPAPIAAVQANLATAATTQAVVAKKDGVAASLAAVHEEMSTKKLEDKSAASKAKKDDTGESSATKSKSKKGAAAAETQRDPDEDVDDKPAPSKKPPATPPTSTAKVTPPVGSKRKAPEEASNGTAAAAEGGAKKAKTESSEDLVFAEPVVLGSTRWRDNCFGIADLFSKIIEKNAGKQRSDETQYGVLRGFNPSPKGVDAEKLENAIKVQRTHVGQLWQACNYLGVTDKFHSLLIQKHLAPQAEAKPADDDDCGF